MHPLLLHSPPVPAYGACILLGIVIAWLLARRLAARTRIDPSFLDLLVPLLMAAGIAGAYLFGWFTDTITDIDAGGVVLLGAMLGATAAGILFARLARIPLGTLGDLLAAPIALAVACGRIGCFSAGCCFGKVSPFPFFPLAVRFPANSFAYLQQLHDGQIAPGAPSPLPVYPVQLYECALCTLLAALLLSPITRPRVSGERFLLLAGGYSLLRFLLEFLRADNPPAWLSALTFSQGICLLLLPLTAALWIFRRHAHQLHFSVAA